MKNPQIEPSNKNPAAASPSGGEAPPRFPRDQRELFGKAIARFQSGDYDAAKALFAEAEAGPSREVAHAARLHARMCDRRLATEPAFKSADDHYNYAIALINQRRVETAERHLRQAMDQIPEGDHLYYALALCRGLSGDLDGAYRHLKKALDLQPRNRALARNDPDFADIVQRPPLRELIYPERHPS